MKGWTVGEMKTFERMLTVKEHYKELLWKKEKGGGLPFSSDINFI